MGKIVIKTNHGDLAKQKEEVDAFIRSAESHKNEMAERNNFKPEGISEYDMNTIFNVHFTPPITTDVVFVNPSHFGDFDTELKSERE